MMMAGRGGKPYDAEIEYLQSSGSQYIDTLVIPAIRPSILLYAKLNVAEDRDLAGLSVATSPKAFTINTDITSKSIWSKYGKKTIGASSAQMLDITSIHKYNLSNFGMYVDDTLVTDLSSVKYDFSTNTNSIYLFGGRTKIHANIYSAKIWDNDVLMFDAIPVRVGTTGYMYDRVSGQLFGNAGTGDFILGNDIN